MYFLLHARGLFYPSEVMTLRVMKYLVLWPQHCFENVSPTHVCSLCGAGDNSEDGKSPKHILFPPGLQTSQDAHFYSSSARFEPFSNQGKTLVIQFTVKHEQNIDCGGGYIKLFPADLDQADMHGDSKYNIMFGKVHYQWDNDGTSKMIDNHLVTLYPHCLGCIFNLYS